MSQLFGAVRPLVARGEKFRRAGQNRCPLCKSCAITARRAQHRVWPHGPARSPVGPCRALVSLGMRLRRPSPVYEVGRRLKTACPPLFQDLVVPQFEIFAATSIWSATRKVRPCLVSMQERSMHCRQRPVQIKYPPPGHAFEDQSRRCCLTVCRRHWLRLIAALKNPRKVELPRPRRRIRRIQPTFCRSNL